VNRQKLSNLEQTVKRDVFFGAGSFIVACVIMILVTTAQTVAQDGSLHETFDSTALPDWHNSVNVFVKDGALYLPPSNGATPPGSWDNMTLTVRLQRSGSTGMAIGYRGSESGSYLLFFDGEQINLGREAHGVGSPLANDTLMLPDGSWVELTITVVGGEHRIDVNGVAVLTASEQNPLPAGGVSFETMHDTTVLIDELTISSGTTAAPLPEESTVGTTAVDLSACETSDAFTVCRDLQYVADGQNAPLGLDLYLPVDSASPPVLVYIHGGGWFEGSKDSCPGATFAQHGYAVACVDYRLATMECAPDTVFPAQIHDVKAAVRWLRQNAAEYGYDADHMGAIGDSSGGHLAALLGVSVDAPNLEGTENPGTSSAVRAVVDWYGPVDIIQGPMVFEDDPCLTNIGALSDIYGGEEVPYFYWTYAWGVFLGGSLTDPLILEQAAQATPLTYVDAHDPPFLIVHGENDGMVPITQSEALANALEAAGVDVTFLRLPYLGHGYASPEAEVQPDLLTLTLQFLDAHLKTN
jgi:acetyl esterase/lipase